MKGREGWAAGERVGAGEEQTTEEKAGAAGGAGSVRRWRKGGRASARDLLHLTGLSRNQF